MFEQWIKDIKGAVPNRASIGKRRERQSRAASPPPRRDLTPLQDSITWTSPATQVRPRDWPPNLDWTAVCTTPIPDNPTGSIISPESLLGSPAYPTLPHPAADVLTALDAQWLSTIYREGFEAIFGSWMGRYSCPFLFVLLSMPFPFSPRTLKTDDSSFGENSLADKYVSISDLCSQLDRWMAESTDEEQAPAFSTRDQQENERDVAIDHSLRSTIEAFSARWLPITARPASLGPGNLNVVQALWRRARRDMLRVINRPSYRSMLTLFLFALTPIPTGISEEEEVDGISGQVCVHAALQQIQSLRARQRNLQFNGSKVLPSSLKTTPAVVAGLVSIGTSSFINAESTAYWAALTFDTSASLTLNCRSLLSSGLFGFKAEPSWRLVRTCAKMFEEDDGVGGGGFEMTDERANQIIAAAAAWKLLGWKLTAVFKEALRDGHDESEIRKAYLAVVDSIEQFNGTYRHLLEACQRRMQFLGQQTRLRWCKWALYFGSLVMNPEIQTEDESRFPHATLLP
jgi:hypothetical protein